MISSPFKGSLDCAWTPELTVKTFDNDDDNVIVDFDIDFDDDLFSVYMDVKKLEEKENDVNVGLDNHDVLQNGGGFVAGSCGGGRCRGRRKRKDKSKTAIITTQPRKQRQRRGLKGCLVDEKRFVEPRKAMAPEELAELWAIDPKRAKRIVANRHSAARSKERKAQYIVNLEEKVKTLNSQVALLNTRLTTTQRETTELVAEKSELRCQLQTLESQTEQIDAQNAALKLEIQWLKAVTGELDDPCHVCQSESLQFPTSMSTHQKPLLHNCQPSTLSPYLHVASPQPLF
nr:bZIP transcription factor 18-like [Coffea arabica]